MEDEVDEVEILAADVEVTTFEDEVDVVLEEQVLLVAPIAEIEAAAPAAQLHIVVPFVLLVDVGVVEGVSPAAIPEILIPVLY